MLTLPHEYGRKFFKQFISINLSNKYKKEGRYERFTNISCPYTSTRGAHIYVLTDINLEFDNQCLHIEINCLDLKILAYKTLDGSQRTTDNLLRTSSNVTPNDTKKKSLRWRRGASKKFALLRNRMSRCPDCYPNSTTVQICPSITPIF